jgi:hypothetical protein
MKDDIENLAYEDATSQNSDFRKKAKLEWIQLSDDDPL